MPAQPAIEALNDELAEFRSAKIRYFRTVDRVIRDGRVEEEERTELAVARAAMKAKFRIVSRRSSRISSGNRMLRLLANTGEITPKAERLFRELVADEARIIAFPSCDDDPDDSGAALKATA